MDSLLSPLLSFFISPALAENFLLRTGIPGPLPPESGILGTIQNAYLLALGFAGVLALGSIVYGAVLYTVSRGNPTALADAWDRIVQALIGVLLLVGAGTILSIVNPGLLSLELPQLQPPVPRTYQAGTVPTPPTAATPNPTIIPPKTPVPVPNQPQVGEGEACQATNLRSYACDVAWSDNDTRCTAAAPNLCTFKKDSSCFRICPSGSQWTGLLSTDRTTCQCMVQTVNTPVDTKGYDLRSCVANGFLNDQVKCSGPVITNSSFCSVEAPVACNYKFQHACYGTCGGYWLGFLKGNGDCLCP